MMSKEKRRIFLNQKSRQKMWHTQGTPAGKPWWAFPDCSGVGRSQGCLSGKLKSANLTTMSASHIRSGELSVACLSIECASAIRNEHMRFKLQVAGFQPSCELWWSCETKWVTISGQFHQTRNERGITIYPDLPSPRLI